MAFARRTGWLLGTERPKIKIGQERIDGKLQDKFVTVTELIDATKNFSDERKLGISRTFFMAELQGYTVAVKRLGPTRFKEQIEKMRKEIGIAGSLQHDNILKLLDVYIEKDLQFLVYEYMKEQSLADFLLARSTNRKLKLDWETRVNICLGIAKGLKYLHEHPRGKIVHGNINPANILLNEDFEAKISDFRYATLCTEEDKVRVIARESNVGYMAPKYLRGDLTDKVDVFSFGVVVLEIVSGKRNVDHSSKVEGCSLLDWAYKFNKNGTLMSLVDKSLCIYNEIEADIILKLALECTGIAPGRPTMSEVVSVLTGIVRVAGSTSGELNFSIY